MKLHTSIAGAGPVGSGSRGRAERQRHKHAQANKSMLACVRVRVLRAVQAVPASWATGRPRCCSKAAHALTHTGQRLARAGGQECRSPDKRAACRCTPCFCFLLPMHSTVDLPVLALLRGQTGQRPPAAFGIPAASARRNNSETRARARPVGAGRAGGRVSWRLGGV